MVTGYRMVFMADQSISQVLPNQVPKGHGPRAFLLFERELVQSDVILFLATV